MTNEDNKYYTPSIEELTVNFEYEVLNKDIWIKKNDFTNAYDYEDSCLYGFIKDLDKGNIRVKYLDQEDIVSLGWIDGDTRGLSGYFLKTEDNDFQMYLHDWLNERGYWFIEIYDYRAEYVFKGIIKNKSELRKTMQQIQII